MKSPSNEDNSSLMSKAEQSIKSAAYKLERFQEIERTWKGDLTPGEFSVVMMVFDRTVMWGKRWETITLDQFQKGVFSRDRSKMFHCGTGLSRQGIVNILKSLVARGCLCGMVCGRSPSAYSINTKWAPKMSKLKLSKKRSDQSTDLTTTSQLSLPRLVNCVDHKYVQEVHKEVQILSASEPITAKSEIERIQQTSRKTRQSRLLRTVDRPSGKELELVWKNAWSEMYGNIPSVIWKERERHAMVKYARRWQEGHSVPFGEYLDWCVRYWQVGMEQGFLGFKGAPELPEPLFFIRFSNRFESSFSRRADHHRMMSKTTRQREVEDRVRKGMPLEIAEQEVDEKMGIAIQRRRLADEQAKINFDRDCVNLARQQLDDMIGREAEIRIKLSKLPGTAKERSKAERAARRFATSDYETNGNGTKH